MSRHSFTRRRKPWRRRKPAWRRRRIGTFPTFSASPTLPLFPLFFLAPSPAASRRNYRHPQEQFYQQSQAYRQRHTSAPCLLVVAGYHNTYFLAIAHRESSQKHQLPFELYGRRGFPTGRNCGRYAKRARFPPCVLRESSYIAGVQFDRHAKPIFG